MATGQGEWCTSAPATEPRLIPARPPRPRAPTTSIRASAAAVSSAERGGSGYLTICAVRSDKTEGKHRSEFRYGSFARTLALPANASEDEATASYRDIFLRPDEDIRVLATTRPPATTIRHK